MKKIKKILVIIQRSNGDVFLSQTLINRVFEAFDKPLIDLLINDDTFSVAKLLSNVNNIYQFSYSEKSINRWTQEKKIVSKIFKKYDLSINLTSSDRSVLYAIISGKKSISAVEVEYKKSWWKKFLLTNYYYFNNKKHILANNLEPLKILNIKHDFVQDTTRIQKKMVQSIEERLIKSGVKDFIIFHPSAQYNYKIYPNHLRDKLLFLIEKLGVSIIVTGSKNEIDSRIKKELPVSSNIINFIGETSIEEYCALSYLSLAYVGMDTLNMHIAAAQNKRIFAIFGPTNLSMWSPWSNLKKTSARDNMPLQTYGNVTIFQADMPCVACGKAGCDDNHGRSDCLYNINPNIIFEQVEKWFNGLEVEITK